MLWLCCSVCLLVLLCHMTVAQDSNPEQWTPGVMPNPKRNPRHCRPANTHNQMEPGYICDPDGILSERDVELLDWLLKGFYTNDTACPCSTYWCEKKHRTGTFATIAIVRKMKVEDHFEDPDIAVLQAGNNFALQLERNFWNFGQCQNDIVIFFSRDDGILSIMYGPIVSRKVSSGMIEYIQSLHGYHFKSGDYFRGFAEIVLALRDALNGRYPYDNFDPRTDSLVGGAGHVTSGILATLVLALISTLLS